MEDTRKPFVGRKPDTMTALPLRAKEAVNAAIYDVVDAHPPKIIARRVGVTERNVRALKYREHEPSAETAIAFGFVYPSVGAVWAHWAAKMLQADFFEPETQRDFYRDYGRAGQRHGE